MDLKTTLKCCGVFVLFALYGAVSAVEFFSRSPEDQFSFFFSLPFALLCAFMFLRRLRQGQRVLIAAPLIMAVWSLSYFCTVAASFVFRSYTYLAGGFIGGAALVLCASLCEPELASAKYIVRGALVGLCSASLFLPAFNDYEWKFKEQFNSSAPILAFAFWEAAVGTYLYAICRLLTNRDVDESHADEEVGSFRVTPR